MIKRKAVTPASGPLEEQSSQFDSWFDKLNQREGFHHYKEIQEQ